MKKDQKQMIMLTLNAMNHYERETAQCRVDKEFSRASENHACSIALYRLLSSFGCDFVVERHEIENEKYLQFILK